MSRYIDADALIARASQDSERMYLESVVRHTRSIDIVRCKECKWRKAKMMPKSVKCLFSGNADDFCSYGEREGE